jgi:hypothetical protein
MRNRRNDWQVAVGKLQREAVLFQNLRIAPTRWSIELGNYRRVIFNPNLVDAVFVTVECQKPPVAAIAEVFQSRNNLFWLQITVGKG